SQPKGPCTYSFSPTSLSQGKSDNRPPLQELFLQPNAVPSPGKVTLASSKKSPMLYRSWPQPEDSSIPPALEFSKTTWTDFPSELPYVPLKELKTSLVDTEEHCLDLVPQTSSTPRTSEGVEAPLNNVVVKTLVPSPSQERSGQELQSNSPLEMVLGTKTEANIFLNLSPSLTDTVTTGSPVDGIAKPVRAISQHAPSHLFIEGSPSHCSEQHHPEENSIDSGTNAVPKASVPLTSNSLLPSCMQQFPTSSVSGVSHPASLSDLGLGSAALTVEGGQLKPSHPSEEVQLAGGSSLPTQIPTKTVAPVEDFSQNHSPSTGSWKSPLAWLDKGVNTSAMLESLRQSFSLPTLMLDIGTSITPVSSSPATPALLEKSTNTSQEGKANTKDNASETDSLLCQPPDMSALSRRDLEDHLLSSLIVLEALSRQLRDQQNSGATSHPKAQDSCTQTDIFLNGVRGSVPKCRKPSDTVRQRSRGAGQSWTLESQELLHLLNQSLLTLKEDWIAADQEHQRTESLVSHCWEVLKTARTKLQNLLEEKDEARSREEIALRGRNAAETILEAFCAHFSQRISQLQQDLESQLELRDLLRKTQTQQMSLHLEQKEVTQQATQLASILQEDWSTMQLDYTMWTAMLGQAQQLMEPLITKSQKALQEQDVASEKEEQVSWQLDQVSAQLEDSKARIEQLELENKRLAADLQLQLQSLADTEGHLEKLQDQYDHCARDLASRDEALAELTLSRDEQVAWWQEAEATLKSAQLELQEQRAALLEEVRELRETLEFLDQENQVAHTELTRLESQLKTTLSALQERNLQCEDLKDSHDNLPSVGSIFPEVHHTEKSLEELTCLMQEAQSLCSQLQDSKEKAVGALQQEICSLQVKLQAQEEQHQEALKIQEAEVKKLSQALCVRNKSEKELQEVIQQQDKKILEQIDKIGEFTSLREEVTQLTRLLQRSETEAKVLQEALACQQNPNSEPMDTAWIQEKVWLCQEVDKLRRLLLEMENEKAALLVKSQSHVSCMGELPLPACYLISP
uniref:Sperm associated antigen 5 n=1 Tax=Monodelphis domestica TaxID=13616 RepID=F6Q8N0_MONDO